MPDTDNRVPRILLCLLPVLLGSLPQAGHAQATDETDPRIEEIIVTSRYRAEKLSAIPDSITAFTRADIERHRIERINGVAALTPNLRFSDDQEVGISTPQGGRVSQAPARDPKKSREHTLGGPAERYALIDTMREGYSITELCDAVLSDSIG